MGPEPNADFPYLPALNQRSGGNSTSTPLPGPGRRTGPTWPMGPEPTRTSPTPPRFAPTGGREFYINPTAWSRPADRTYLADGTRTQRGLRPHHAALNQRAGGNSTSTPLHGPVQRTGPTCPMGPEPSEDSPHLPALHERAGGSSTSTPLQGPGRRTGPTWPMGPEPNANSAHTTPL